MGHTYILQTKFNVFRNIFDAVKSSGQDCIHFEDFHELCGKFGMSRESSRSLFRKIGTNNKGVISFREFKKGIFDPVSYPVFFLSLFSIINNTGYQRW